ncbi:MAG: hypothetical protein CMI53_02575 [Parcubacteria group bacterium]|jgi:rubrerythrin|nr:hypothetical protein [Parcubacteria group bacterium]|tara:strand:- start:3502 stop:3699 length:198 start_codon:yes stop_codon:yes gene_type:complete
MTYDLVKETKRAIAAELKLQQCYREMSTKSDNPKVRAVIHDLLLMEEMNEVLLRSLNHSLSSLRS